MSFDINYAGIFAKNMGLVVTDRPAIPAPVFRYESTAVRGRDGSLRIYDGAVEDIEVSINFAFYAPETGWMARRRAVTEWLLARPAVGARTDQTEEYSLDADTEMVTSSGRKYLYFSDETEYCYHVKQVKLSAMNRQLRKLGNFTATFICAGYEYLREGLEEKTIRQVENNPYDLCKPVYLIEGNGTCALVVNNASFRISVGESAVIDTELMISYRNDGTLINTDVTGDYESLWLRPGENDITATAGFTVKVIPRWRCL